MNFLKRKMIAKKIFKDETDTFGELGGSRDKNTYKHSVFPFT